MSTTQKIFIVIVIGLVLIIGVLAFPWVGLFITQLLTSGSSKPAIQYAEFPFKLEYKINGELMVGDDILICKYDGVIFTEAGKLGTWKRYFASGNEEIVLLQTDDIKITYPISVPANYFMGDNDVLKEPFEDMFSFPNASLFEWRPLGELKWQYRGGILADELLEKYGIELISWEIAPPIENTFK